MTIIEDWIKTEQSKHRLCVCGCGQEIIIKPHHYKKGIPHYFPGHYSKLMANTQHCIDKRIKIRKFIEDNQDQHICQCGCGNYIKIRADHITNGIPKYIIGHSTKGRIVSNETRLKMSISKRNMSDETKKKMSMSVLRRGIKSIEETYPCVDATLIDEWVIENQGKHFCKCGCGLEIKIEKKHYYLGIPNYAPRKPRKQYSKTGNGRPCTIETRKKISDAQIGEKNHNYGRHHSPEHLFKISGKKHSNWNGGTSFGPYCHKFNNRLKERIRERDNRTCQGCGVKENGRRLAVHHIHYDRENCYPDLIALCNSCHMKTNTNRQYWEEYYTNILETRGLLNWS